MCRLLCVKSKSAFLISGYLRKFAEVAQSSKEYQGHGWGFAYILDGAWRTHHSPLPIWEDNLAMAASTKLLLAHARSAFMNAGMSVENNMPFTDGKYMFIFNGELRGVRIREKGRIGAEKLFNFVRRFDKGSMLDALRMAMAQLERRTAYIKAANVMMSEGTRVFLASRFNENPEYYTLQKKYEDNKVIVCSETFRNEKGWTPISPGVYEVS